MWAAKACAFCALIALRVVSSSTCLPDAKDPSEWTNITVAGESTAIQMIYTNWDSANIISIIEKIIITEVLGYNLDFAYSTGSSSTCAQQIAGCVSSACLTDDTQFYPKPKYHLSGEAWMQGFGLPFLLNLAAAYPQRPQVVRANLGYYGLDGFFTPRGPVVAAMDAIGLALVYYQSYNASHHDPAAFFDKVSDVMVNASLLDNNATRNPDSYSISGASTYASHFSSTDPNGLVMENVGGTMVPQLNFQHGYNIWWVSPACRADLTKCVPAVTNNWWGAVPLMQRAATYNMPIAIAEAGWSNFVNVARSFTVLHYWWTPDVTFLSKRSMHLQYPPHDAIQWEQESLMITMARNVDLVALVHPEMERVAPPVYKTLMNLALSNSQMDNMLLQTLDGMTHYQVACSYLNTTSSWRSWVPSPTKCDLGQGLQTAAGDLTSNYSAAASCQRCPLGRNSIPLQDTHICVECPAGKKGNSVGAWECVDCDAGKYTGADGLSSCSNCPIGAYSNISGQTVCRSCPDGQNTFQYTTDLQGVSSWTALVGAATDSACVCDIGYFGDRSSCIACPAGSTTLDANSSSSLDCRCQAATYMTTGSVCAACLEGMECPFGADAHNFPANGGTGVGTTPLVKAGYFTTADEPMSVWVCTNEDWCPGGGSGTCLGLRTDLVCAECPEDTYGTDCNKCDAGIWVIVLIASFVIGFGIVSFITLDGAIDLLNESEGRLMMGMVAGIVCETVQIVASVSNLDIGFNGALGDFVDSFGIAQFDISVLQSECVHGQDPVAVFASLQVVAPCIVSFALGGLLLKKLYRGSKMPLNAVNLFAPWLNGIGVFWAVFFLAICILAFAPFVCFTHPNGKQSVQQYPQVLCYEGGSHTDMICLAVVAVILIPIPFMSCVTYATMKFPARIVKMDRQSDVFLRATRFMFLDLVPNAFCFPAMLLYRNLCIAIVPIIFGGDGGLQVVGAATVLMLFRTIQEKMPPFRIKWCNNFDLVAQSLVVLLLIFGAVASDLDPEQSKLAILQDISMVMLCILLMAPIAFAAWHKYDVGTIVFGRKNHDFHICHNRLNAAAQCLLLKHFIEETGHHVYLDNSMVLSGMDEYLAAVRHGPEKFIAYLTARALQSPTFVSEVVVAFHAHVTVTKIQTPSFLTPSAKQMDNLGQYIDTTGICLLMLGVTLKKARDAIDQLFAPEVPCIELNDSLDGVFRMKDIALSLFAGEKGTKMEKDTLPDEAGLVFLSAEPRSDEAVAAASYIKFYLQNHMKDCYSLTDYGEDARAKSKVLVKARAVVIILSEATLESGEQMTIMVNAMYVQDKAQQKGTAALVLIPVAMPTFRFPSSQRFYDEIAGHMGLGSDAAFIKQVVMSLSHLDMITFPVHESVSKLHHYIEEIKEMIPSTIDLKEASAQTPLEGRRLSFVAQADTDDVTTEIWI